MSDEPISIPGRLLPEDHAALFAKHGVIPDQRDYLGVNDDGMPCGCAIGVLFAEHAGSVAKANAIRSRFRGTFSALLATTLLPAEYLGGLSDGFSLGYGLADEDICPKYKAGVTDGIAIRKLVF